MTSHKRKSKAQKFYDHLGFRFFGLCDRIRIIYAKNRLRLRFLRVREIDATVRSFNWAGIDVTSQSKWGTSKHWVHAGSAKQCLISRRLSSFRISRKKPRLRYHCFRYANTRACTLATLRHLRYEEHKQRFSMGWTIGLEMDGRRRFLRIFSLVCTFCGFSPFVCSFSSILGLSRVSWMKIAGNCRETVSSRCKRQTHLFNVRKQPHSRSGSLKSAK